MSSFPKFTISSVRAGEITCELLYSALRLRSEVFVVEQNALYLDLDNRDLEPSTTHVLAIADNEVIGNIRLMEEPEDSIRLGRVCVAYKARGHGIARALLARALEISANRTVDAHAQSHLAPWYEGFGFVATGPVFHEVGIPHVPMRRAAL